MCLNSSQAAKLCFRKLIFSSGIEPRSLITFWKSSPSVALNETAVLLLEAGVSYNKQRPHQVGSLPVSGGDQSGHERWTTLAAANVLGHDGTPGENGERTG